MLLQKSVKIRRNGRVSKIKDHGVASVGNHDVFRFQIAMDDIHAMGDLENFRDLHGNTDFFVSGQGIGHLVKGFSGNQFHDYEILVMGFNEIVNSANIGVFQFG